MKENLEEMKQIDIRTVDIETLKDIRDVQIDQNWPIEKRKEEYLKQIHNPYCFRCGNIAVKVEYSEDGPTLEQCLQEYLQGSLFDMNMK